jgi:hypothetical protein
MADAQRFRNASDGYIGVVVINEQGKREGTPVGPGDTVELTEEEQRLTAHAPRDPADNPFIGGIPGPPETDEKGETRPGPQRPALVPDHEQRHVPRPTTPQRESDESAVAAEPAGEQAVGSYQGGEEVATPEAPSAA